MQGNGRNGEREIVEKENDNTRHEGSFSLRPGCRGHLTILLSAADRMRSSGDPFKHRHEFLVIRRSF
jgi:hypothetical protein